jgi:glycosyltransferase involved in cell wall biosynthesis
MAEGVCVRHGFLSRSDPAQRRRLEDLFLSSHILLMPTRAECFGISFAEAQAFGLPPVAFAIDALPTVVEHGVTGLLLPRNSHATAFADSISALMAGGGRYTAMCFAARQRFLAQLNWPACASRLMDIIALR